MTKDKLNKLIIKERGSFGLEISEEDADKISKNSEFTKEEILEEQKEIEDFWKKD